MKRSFSHGVVVAAAVLVTLPAAPPTAYPVMPKEQQNDPRLAKLRHFLAESHCPVWTYAEDFLAEADAHRLDWRLLPSISVIESGGGKDFRNNNIFGWDSGKAFFPSIQAGIHSVARTLEISSLYRNKGVDGILHIYNPNEEYAGRVRSLMSHLSPGEDFVE